MYISLSWENCGTLRFCEVLIVTETSKMKLQDNTGANLWSLPCLITWRVKKNPNGQVFCLQLKLNTVWCKLFLSLYLTQYAAWSNLGFKGLSQHQYCCYYHWDSWWSVKCHQLLVCGCSLKLQGKKGSNNRTWSGKFFLSGEFCKEFCNSCEHLSCRMKWKVSKGCWNHLVEKKVKNHSPFRRRS